MPPKKAILHIGTHKTGSSSIQHTLNKATDNGQLERFAFQRAISCRLNGNNLLPLIYRPLSEAPREVKNEYGGDSALYQKHQKAWHAKFLDFLGSNERVVLSSEYLINFPPAALSKLGDDLLQAGFHDVTIVLYIREPASYYISSVQQILKASKIIKPPGKFHYNFRKIVEKWNGAFPNKLLIRPFNRSELYNHCVVQDFLQIIGNLFDLSDLARKLDIIDVNQSLSAEAMLILQNYRETFYYDRDDVFYEDSSRLVRLLDQSQNSISQTPPALKKNIKNMIMKNHGDILQWLENTYGIRFYEPNAKASVEIDESACRASRLEEILDAYDPEIVHRLLLYCLNRALTS